MVLSLFLLVRVVLTYLPTALSVALGPSFPFQQAQYAQVFLLKPVPFCKLFAGLGSTNKYAISLLLRSDSRSVLAALSYSPSFLLPQSLWQICLLSPVLSVYNRSTDTRFSRGTTRLMSWPDGERCLRHLQSLLVSPLISHIHSSLFSNWRRSVSSRIFDTEVPSISTEELVLPRHACCVLSRLRCNGHSLLLSSYLSRIGRRKSFLQRLRTLVPVHLSSHSVLSSYGLFAPLALWRLSISLQPLVQALGSCPASGAPWSPRHAPIPRKESGNNNRYQANADDKNENDSDKV